MRGGNLHEVSSDDTDKSRPAGSSEDARQKNADVRSDLAELQRAFEKLVTMSQKYVNGDCTKRQWQSTVNEVTRELQTHKPLRKSKEP